MGQAELNRKLQARTVSNHFFSGGTIISGAQLASTISNMASLGGIGRQVLREFGIETIDPDQHYPFQIRRSIHATVLRRFGPEALYSFGFGYGDSWVHIHESIAELRNQLLSERVDHDCALTQDRAIGVLGHEIFVMMHALLEKNSHDDVYFGAWFTRLGDLHYRAEMRNTSSPDQEAFPHGLFVNFFWAVLSDYWKFDVTFIPSAMQYGEDWTHFVWEIRFTPHRSSKTAQELTWEHRLEAREALLSRVLSESEEKNRLIMESMNYARLLQEAQLPRPARYTHYLRELGVLWEPRDTIGGDLWWITPDDQSSVFTIVVVDCAGHGVPGAMLALLASTNLERIYASENRPRPATALQQLGNALRRSLNQDQSLAEGEIAHDDGCDAAALRIDLTTGEAIFAGANLSLIHLPMDGPVRRWRGDAVRLGYRDAADAIPAELELQVHAGDRLILNTDGVVDQIGTTDTGALMAFGFKRLLNFFESHRHLHASALMQALGVELQRWQGNGLRRDDVTALCLNIDKSLDHRRHDR